MPCTEPLSPLAPWPQPQRRHPRRLAGRLPALAGVVLLCAGCGQSPPPAAPAPAAPPPGAHRPVPPPAPHTAPHPGQAGPGHPAAPPWRHARSWDDYRHQAALRLVALNREHTYSGEVPQPALAIPVLEIELNADGSLRRIHVLRRPGQAADTVQLAIAAVQRAAPFGAVGHLPRPWKFTETFLFDHQRRFKPRTLDG